MNMPNSNMVCLVALILAMVCHGLAERNFLISRSILESSPECDLILFNLMPEDFEMLIANHNDRATIVLTKGHLQPNEHAKCYVMVIDSQNDTSSSSKVAADTIFYAARSPFKLVTLAQEFNKETPAKNPYDSDQVTSMGVQKYVANADERWSKLRTAYTFVHPFLSRTKLGGFSGLDWEIWEIICKSLELELVMTEKHLTYASAYDTLAKKNVDLTFPQNPFSFPLRQVSEQTMFVYYETYSFYNIIPGPVTNMLTLFYPFNGVVWAWSLAAFLFAFVAIYLIRLKTSMSLFRAIQLLLSPLLNDSAARNWRSLHNSWYGYSILFMWLCSALLLSFAYTSNLLANLTVVEQSKADNTFEDLLKNKRTLAVPAGTFLENWMKESSREIIRQVEQECTMKRDGYYNVYEFRGVPPKMKEKLEKGEASSLVLVSMFANLVHKYRLGTDILRGTFSTYFLQLRHPKRPLVDKLLGKLYDSGILLKLKQKAIWTRGRPARDFERNQGGAEKTENQQLSIKHMYPLWIVFTIGIIGSILLFMLEKSKNLGKKQIYV